MGIDSNPYIVLKSQLFVIDEFDEFEKLDGFGDAMEDLEPSDHAPRFTSLNISSIANLDYTVLYYTPGQTKIFPYLNIVLQESL
ncbi:unnamed protein product [Rhizophagus irregularis]|uniref:Uncharacterized protein n=1 Tax=Rhizophagus irregularis TaxID=588596 RepID=A0A916EHY2_9GLOM|nr:unnamed protein product [Rhizophagus irregularis]